MDTTIHSKKYIGWHKQLIEQYAAASKKYDERATKEHAVNKSELETTLKTIQDYAHTVLSQYQLTSSDQERSSTLPLSALPTHSQQNNALMLQATQGTTPYHADQSLQNYIAAMNSAQQHTLFAHQSPQARMLREQFALLGFGVAIIGIITLIGRFLLLRNLDKQASISDQYDQQCSDISLQTGRMRALAHCAQQRSKAE